MNTKDKKKSVSSIATVKSSTKGMAFGNIIAGGLIGAAVDMGTGAAYDYPSLIDVSMGTTTTIAPQQQKKDGDLSTTDAKAAQTGASATQTTTAAAAE